MKKRIAYVELDTHAEVLSQFHELMGNSQNFDVDFFVSQRINRIVKNETFHPTVTEPKKLLKLLKSQDYDLVILGTAHRYFNTFLKIVRNFPTAVISHNLNFSKMESTELLKAVPLDDSTYRTKLLLLEGLLSAKKIYDECDYQLVLDKNMAGEKRLFLPLYYFKNTPKPRNPIPKIVIPGAVSQHRRDYFRVIQILEKVKQPLEVYFLGKAEGEELLAVQNLASKTRLPLKVHYYTQKLPQRDFSRILSKADILWCPIQIDTEFFSQTEIYGTTKSSGNLGDAITFGKKAVFPKDYKSNYPFIINESEDFLSQIGELLHGSDYDFESEFSFSKIQTELEQALNRMLQRL